ncbi:hypothetical protein [Granulicella arctica]|uniref:hypothetical protein n=1 Tax=Granulicella arctica TaxID=940613 RepID=UPI0021DF94FB|nr:hypothetical protein [Granulicella arctica]
MLVSLVLAFVFLPAMALAQDQKLASPEKQTIVCEEQAPECTHRLINGLNFKTLVGPQAIVTLGIGDNGKYTRLDVTVTNTSQSTLTYFRTPLA